MEDFILKPGYIVVTPLDNASSSLVYESKKYDRKAIGRVVKCGLIIIGERDLLTGDIVVFDDSHSVDFIWEGKPYMVINQSDLRMVKEEDGTKES